MWFTNAKHGRQHHIARLGDAGSKLRIGVERGLGFGNQFAHLLGSWLLIRRIGVTQSFFDFANVLQATVGLRLKEEGGVGDDFDFCACEQIRHLGMDITTPGPAPNVCNAGVINRYNGDFV